MLRQRAVLFPVAVLLERRAKATQETVGDESPKGG